MLGGQTRKSLLNTEKSLLNTEKSKGKEGHLTHTPAHPAPSFEETLKEREWEVNTELVRLMFKDILLTFKNIFKLLLAHS